jgi:hypothetical protein
VLPLYSNLITSVITLKPKVSDTYSEFSAAAGITVALID